MRMRADRRNGGTAERRTERRGVPQTFRRTVVPPFRRSAFLIALASVACARMEPPPGGPPDAEPPQLVATVPDSLAQVPGFRGAVEFRFDEVVSEGSSPSTGTGTGDLEKLIILSPSTRVPDVSWKRSRIAVRPSEGWQPDRVYRVELLPGVTDLRRNRSEEGKVVTFSTGAPLPGTTLEGTVVDWSSARPAPGALVEALLLPDSLPYRAVADSSGRFSFGPLPDGDYLVSGVLDQNRNHLADGREAFDSVRVPQGRGNVGELWAFVHDTTPARIRTVTVADSVGATVELSQSIDPRLRIETTAVTVALLPDSTPLPVVSVLPKPVDDSVHAAAAAAADKLRADSLRADSARADTAARRLPGGRPRARPVAPQQLTTRPPLTDRLVVRVSRPWTPGARYTITIRGLRNLSGVAGDAVGTLAVPERPAADSLAAPRDSLQPRDSLGPAPEKARPAPKPKPSRVKPPAPAPSR